MVLNPDGARPDSEAAAHRRWLITVAITILFGTFGAVMTYLTYAERRGLEEGRAKGLAEGLAEGGGHRLQQDLAVLLGENGLQQ